MGKYRKILGIMSGIIMIMGSVSVGAEPEVQKLPQLRFPTGDLAAAVPPETVSEISEEEADRMSRAIERYNVSDEVVAVSSCANPYYYSQLDFDTQGIYNCLLMVAEDPVSVDNYSVLMTMVDPLSEEFYYKLHMAYTAMTYDHPEYFWLYNQTETSIDFYTSGADYDGWYEVYFALSDPYVNYKEQMTAFQTAVETFMADIDLNKSEYEVAKEIHDKLLDTVTYDMNVCDSDAEGQNLAHTAYGALVANTQGTAHYAVCDGYALAYEYLLGMAGIDSIFLGGFAGNTELDAGGHAWNLVKLDGEWYEVDCTWDDAGTLDSQITPDIDGYAYFLEALEDAEYRDKLQHYLFALSTEDFRSYVADERYDYITKDGLIILSLVSDSVHIRFEDNGYNPQGSVISLAPLATSSLQW